MTPHRHRGRPAASRRSTTTSASKEEVDRRARGPGQRGAARSWSTRCIAGEGGTAAQLHRFVRGDVARCARLPFDINEVHRIAARDRERLRRRTGASATGCERRLARIVRAGVADGELPPGRRPPHRAHRSGQRRGRAELVPPGHRAAAPAAIGARRGRPGGRWPAGTRRRPRRRAAGVGHARRPTGPRLSITDRNGHCPFSGGKQRRNRPSLGCCHRPRGTRSPVTTRGAAVRTTSRRPVLRTLAVGIAAAAAGCRLRQLQVVGDRRLRHHHGLDRREDPARRLQRLAGLVPAGRRREGGPLQEGRARTSSSRTSPTTPSSLDALVAGSSTSTPRRSTTRSSRWPPAADQQIVVVNDNSTGNDQVICDKSITTVAELKGKTIAAEAGVVDHFLLLQGLAKDGMTENDINFQGVKTDAAAAAFAGGQFDCVAVFAPFTVQALEAARLARAVQLEGLPGRHPRPLVATADVVEEQLDAELQKLVERLVPDARLDQGQPRRGQRRSWRRRPASPRATTPRSPRAPRCSTPPRPATPSPTGPATPPRCRRWPAGSTRSWCRPA